MRKILMAGLALCYGHVAAAQITQTDANTGADTERAAPQINRVVEPLPTVPSVQNIHRVVAAKTPSGFEVPRYVSLKYGKTNGRAGPSQNHPILWEYRRRGLPVIVVAETELWRKIRDMNGDEAWVYRAGLSGERSVVALHTVAIQKRADDTARTVAVAETGALMRLEACQNDWCKVWADDGLKGYAPQSSLWGAKPLY